MKTASLLIAFVCFVQNLSAQYLINKQTSRIHLGTNLTGLLNNDMFAEGFVMLTHLPSKFQICMQGGPLLKTTDPLFEGLPVREDFVIRTNNTGLRSRININFLTAKKYFIGLQYQYKLVNTTHQYLREIGQSKTIVDHNIVKTKQSLSIETGFFTENKAGFFFQVSGSAGLAYQEIRAGGSSLLRPTFSDEQNENFLPQIALSIKTGCRIYGRN
jgi:hypothetical protein